MEISTSTHGDLTFIFTATSLLNNDEKQYYNDYVFSEIEHELLTQSSYIKPRTCPIYIILNEETKADEKIKQILDIVMPTYNETLDEIPDDSVLVLFTSVYDYATSFIYKFGTGETFIHANDAYFECTDCVVELVKMNLLDLLSVSADAYDCTFNHIRSNIRDFMVKPEILHGLDGLPEVSFFNDKYSHYTALIAFAVVPALFRDNYIRVVHAEDNPLKDVCLLIGDKESLKTISFNTLYKDKSSIDPLKNYDKAIPLTLYVKTHFPEVALLQSFMK